MTNNAPLSEPPSSAARPPGRSVDPTPLVQLATGYWAPATLLARTYPNLNATILDLPAAAAVPCAQRAQTGQRDTMFVVISAAVLRIAQHPQHDGFGNMNWIGWRL